MRAGSQYTVPTKGQDTHPSQPPMPPHGLLGSSKKASLFLSMLRNDEAFSFYKSLFPCRSTEKRAFVPLYPLFGLPKLKAEINP